jgi:hypothetical protein
MVGGGKELEVVLGVLLRTPKKILAFHHGAPRVCSRLYKSEKIVVKCVDLLRLL